MLEGSHSGLVRVFAKHLRFYRLRGFESLLLRQHSSAKVGICDK